MTVITRFTQEPDIASLTTLIQGILGADFISCWFDVGSFSLYINATRSLTAGERTDIIALLPTVSYRVIEGQP